MGNSWFSSRMSDPEGAMDENDPHYTVDASVCQGFPWGNRMTRAQKKRPGLRGVADWCFPWDGGS